MNFIFLFCISGRVCIVSLRIIGKHRLYLTNVGYIAFAISETVCVCVGGGWGVGRMHFITAKTSPARTFKKLRALRG